MRPSRAGMAKQTGSGQRSRSAGKKGNWTATDVATKTGCADVPVKAGEKIWQRWACSMGAAESRPENQLAAVGRNEACRDAASARGRVANDCYKIRMAWRNDLGTTARESSD